MKRFSFNFVTSGPYAVDIFFWMAGFLGVYLSLGKTKKRNGKVEFFLLSYLHRYLRIVPMFLFTMLFFWFIMTAVGSGPIFFQMYQQKAKY